MSSHVPIVGLHVTPWMDRILLALAVTLMVGGVVMIFTDVSAAIAIPAIAVGIAITALVRLDERRSRRS